MSYPPQQPGPYGPHGYPRQGPYDPWQGYPPPHDPYAAQQGYPPQPGYQPGQVPPGAPQGLFGGTPHWAQQAYPGQQWGAPQPPPRRKKTGLIVTCVVLGAVVLLGAGVVTWFFAFRDGDIVAGDCIGSEEVAVDADVFEAECGSAESGFRVLKVVKGGSTEDCSGSFFEQEPGEVLCTTFDVTASDCLTTGGNPDAVPIKVDCADPTAQLVVNSVKPTEPDKGVCAPEEIPFGTRTPPLTVCLSWLRSS